MGGFDSTFCIAQLLITEACEMEPVYMVNPARRSAALELATI